MKRALVPCGVILLIALLITYAVSFAWHVDVFVGDWHIGVLSGSAHLVRDKSASAIWPITCSGERVASIDWTAVDWLPRRSSSSRYEIGFLPLWLPLAIIAAATALLHRSNRRASSPASCPQCRYDLTGNASGVCPECGHTLLSTGN